MNKNTFGIGEREIKFRYWFEDSDDWMVEDGNRMIYNLHNTTDWECLGGFSDDRFIVMQYTGLKDKNGKEIYEGDISCNKFKMKHVVGFLDGGYVLFPPEPKGLAATWFDVNEGQKMIDRNKLEIIGNIFENPDLLTDTES